MYHVKKKLEISSAHQLHLPYESKCKNVHGHNWTVQIYCKAARLNKSGMIVDFTKIKEVILNNLDHQFINEVIPELNPTAENLARWICEKVSEICETGYCYRVDVQESEGNTAMYMSEGEEYYEDI